MAQFSPSGRTPFDRYFAPPPPDGGRPDYYATLGAHSYTGNVNLCIGRESSFSLLIGRYTSIADQLTIIAGLNHIYKDALTTYPFDALEKEFLSYGKTYLAADIPHNRRLDNLYQVIIGNDVWIGRNTTITGGVKIGSGAIIGSNSMVTKDIPPYAVAVGNPARVVKYRFDEATIKKFMAIKWWNWDLDKVCANVPKMYDVEKFLSEHYNPALDNLPNDVLAQEVATYRAAGREVYSFIADFRSPNPVWRRVLRGMLSSDLKNAALIFFVGLGANDKDIAELQNFPQTMEKITSMPIVKCVTSIGGWLYSPNTLRQSTHFITNREMITVECLDWLYNTDVKILSAMNDGIFAGEPLVNWNKI